MPERKIKGPAKEGSGKAALKEHGLGKSALMTWRSLSQSARKSVKAAAKTTGQDPEHAIVEQVRLLRLQRRKAGSSAETGGLKRGDARSNSVRTMRDRSKARSEAAKKSSASRAIRTSGESGIGGATRARKDRTPGDRKSNNVSEMARRRAALAKARGGK